jgi:hypothetical protein
MAKSDNNAKNVLEALLEGTDYSEVLTEQQRTKLTELINETVDARVSAKETLLTEEFEKKETELKESVEAEKQRLLTEAEENEKVLVEQAESYKKELEEAALRQTKEFKENAEAKLAEKAELLREKLESMVYAEAKAYKKKKDAALVEEVKQFKGEMIEKVSDYMEAKLEDMIPHEILESAAKLDVYEPLVTGIMENFSRNFVKLDDTSYQLIKESKEHITRLENDLQAEKKRNITLLKEKKEVEKNVKVEALTEGLTSDQRSRAKKLLEGFDADELDGRWAKVRDIVLESERKPAPKKTEKKPEQKTQPLNENDDKNTKKDEPAKTQQDDAVINMQVKKVLKEGVVEDEKPEVKKESETLNESEQRVQQWASKVKPKYMNG